MLAECEEIEAILKVCSIGFASNLPNTDRFFVRSSSTSSAATVLVGEFLTHCFDVETQFYESLPIEIIKTLHELDESSKTKFSNERTELQSMLYQLRKYTEFPILGFNSGKTYPMLHMTYARIYISLLKFRAFRL